MRRSGFRGPSPGRRAVGALCRCRPANQRIWIKAYFSSRASALFFYSYGPGRFVGYLISRRENRRIERRSTALCSVAIPKGFSMSTTESLPFAELLGLNVTRVTPERIDAELKVRDDLCTRPAVL